ncbi:MAG: 50S ribosomal protein L10 [bacterium]|nr:50S ribosomal protein L10 [bacterium]
MAKSRQQKEDSLKNIDDLLDNKGVVFFNYNGLKVVEVEELRSNLREESGSMTVAKRNLLQLSLKNKGIELDGNPIDGPIAIAIADDEVAPAKIVANFKKKHEQVEFYGGLLEGSFMDNAQVSNLASLPSKQELLAKAVGSIGAPLSGFVNVLAGNIRGLTNALNAIKDNK